MAEVWKYTMDHPRSVFQMPEHAIPLSVGVQDDDKIVLWAEVKPANGKVPRVFNAINTGEQLPPDRESFVGTVQIAGPLGPIVWHIFEVFA